MSQPENAFSGLKSKDSEESPKKHAKKPFAGGKSLHETVVTPWLEKRPVQKEMDALTSLSKSFGIILGNPP